APSGAGSTVAPGAARQLVTTSVTRALGRLPAPGRRADRTVSRPPELEPARVGPAPDSLWWRHHIRASGTGPACAAPRERPAGAAAARVTGAAGRGPGTASGRSPTRRRPWREGLAPPPDVCYSSPLGSPAPPARPSRRSPARR